MNTKLSASGRPVVVAAEKITKNEIDKALAEGKTHVKFTNNKVQRRLLKQQEKIRRQQEIRENKYKAAQKAAANTRRAIPGGGIGLLRKESEVTRAKGTAHFIDKSGKHIPVPAELVEDITAAFEAQPIREEQDEEEDLTGAAGPEYRYLQQGEEGHVFLNIYGDANNYKPFPEIGEMVRPDGLIAALRVLDEGVVLSEEDKAQLLDVDYVFDKLFYAQPGAFTPADAARLTSFQTVTPFEGMGPVVALEDMDNVGTCGMGLPRSVDDLGIDLNRAPDLNRGVEVKITKIESIDDIPDDIGERHVDSIMAEHLDSSGINPFDLPISGSRSQMFASHLSAVPKAEETQLFQPDLAAAVTATARENMEAVRDSLGVVEGSGLESITKLDNSTEQ